MAASTHWLCPDVRVGVSSLELSFQAARGDISALGKSSAGAIPLLEDLSLSFPSAPLSRGGGHKSKCPPWAHTWKGRWSWGRVSWMLLE